MNLMKASDVIERDRPWYRRYRKMLGISLACWVNTALDVVGFALAPLAIIAPIGGVTIVASVLFARCGCAGERELVRWQQWAAILGVVAGVGVVAVCGPHPEPVLNGTQVLQRYYAPSFVSYQLLALVVVALTYTGIKFGKLGAPVLETTMATAASAGMLSGITQTIIKVMAVCVADFLLTSTLPFAIPEFWIVLVELISVALVLLHMLNMCIASAPLSLATPLYMVAVILFTIIASCAFYGDLEMATKVELMLFMLGVTLVLGGLGVLIAMREQTGEQLLPQVDKGKAPDAPAATAPPAEPLETAIDSESVLVDDPDL